MQIKHKFLLLLFIALSKTAFGQEIMTYKGSKQYPATASWNFICENYALTGITKVQIAKSDKGGLLKLATQTTDSSFNIEGTVYIYLSDNSIIVCSDKGIRENTGNQIISYYSFSEIEMNKLRKRDIESLRFNIKGNQKKFSSQTGNFTASNEKVSFKTDNAKTNRIYNTAQEISALYK